MLGAVIFAVTVSSFVQGGPTAMVHQQATNKWRSDYADSLTRPEGWLSVAGLYWLKEGSNTVGSAEECEVRLPAHASPPMAGSLVRTGKSVKLTVFPGVDLQVNGQPATTVDLKSDAADHVDKMSVGGVTFKVIERGERVGIRLYDSKCPGRVGYHGLHWYPAEDKWRVQAQFVPYNPPKPGTITNVLGDASPTTFPGYLAFKVNGIDCRLDVEDAGDTFFINFQDSTSGKTTYGAGRFIEDAAKPDKDGNVWIDFNHATCPPCAYTSFATCPLPPPGNRLKVAITAGEKKYHS
jgi:uncharacterized protein (DUF1684 family)